MLKKENKEIIKGISEYLERDLSFSEIKLINNEIENNFNLENGFYINLEKLNFDYNILVIDKNYIFEILYKRMENLVKETCNIPNWLEKYIDYLELTKDANRAIEFNSYDSTENETENYYLYKSYNS